MRIAAIDIGTNSVHMIVVRVRPDLSFEIVDREKEMVRLGAGGLDGRALTERAMQHGLLALSRFRRLADAHRVDEIVAAATSAVREADNGPYFLDAILDRTGIRARVISGTEEARLIHQAAVYGVDVGADSAVVVDIGGGSVELTVGSAAGATFTQSLKIGVIRLAERFGATDPLSKRDEREMTRYVSEAIADPIAQIHALGFDRVIGTSGTILSLGTLASGDNRDSDDDVRNLRVPAKQFRRVRRELATLNLHERLRVPGLDPRRADLIVAGAILFDTIVRALDVEEVTLCDLSLREGLALDYIHRNRTKVAKVEQYPDVRRRSVMELAERCNVDADHAGQVARIALSLFDQTADVHGLAGREREWLDYAAVLHDIGVHISFPRHHKHSYYLVKNGDLRGFEPEEVEVIALTTRYHRRATPKKGHPGYGGLPSAQRRTVRILAALLRLAEGLDRSHSQSVNDVIVSPIDDAYFVRVGAHGDTELEMWAAQRHVAPLEQVLGRPIRFELLRPSAAPVPATQVDAAPSSPSTASGAETP
ncbi:MAG: Ppx/GppA phosphatase family protein [Acidobacteria bacterium]|nr:Ppx/GppA phosphatase family protein [Acidobacteriota bacterium]